MKQDYLFTSQRLGFRQWNDNDLDDMARISVDAEVMKYFPSTQSKERTASFIQRMQQLYAERQFCYFATDRLDTGKFIGFIGLSVPTFESNFTPCIDIGWRLDRVEWNNGFATEGAKRCLRYGFEQCGIEEVYSMAPKANKPSISIMQKIGMKYVEDFKHPVLQGDVRLEDCMLYKITKPRN